MSNRLSTFLIHDFNLPRPTPAVCGLRSGPYRWDRDSDGRLGTEEFVLLCAAELGLQREDSLNLLRRVVKHRRDGVRLATFADLFLPPSEATAGAGDERDTAAAREAALAFHLLGQVWSSDGRDVPRRNRKSESNS